MSKSTKIIAALGVAAGLGVSALPMSSYAAEGAVSGKVNLEVTVSDAIAITVHSSSDDENKRTEDYLPTNATVIDNFAPDAANKIAVSSAKISMLPNAFNDKAWSEVTVYTNAASGYTLGITSVDDLVNGDYTIPAINSGKTDAPTKVEAGTSAWGYRLTGESAYVGVNNNALKTTNSKTNHGDKTKIEYGVSTSADQATGTYADEIVYTATSNPTI